MLKGAKAWVRCLRNVAHCWYEQPPPADKAVGLVLRVRLRKFAAREMVRVTGNRLWLTRPWGDRKAGSVFRPIDCQAIIEDQQLSDRAVALIVKRHAEAAGLDPV
jgi:hypothetical protein